MACEHVTCPDCGHEMADHRFGCPGTEEALNAEHEHALIENQLRDALADLGAELSARGPRPKATSEGGPPRLRLAEPEGST